MFEETWSSSRSAYCDLILSRSQSISSCCSLRRRAFAHPSQNGSNQRVLQEIQRTRGIQWRTGRVLQSTPDNPWNHLWIWHLRWAFPAKVSVSKFAVSYYHRTHSTPPSQVRQQEGVRSHLRTHRCLLQHEFRLLQRINFDNWETLQDTQPDFRFDCGR